MPGITCKLMFRLSWLFVNLSFWKTNKFGNSPLQVFNKMGGLIGEVLKISYRNGKKRQNEEEIAD